MERVFAIIAPNGVTRDELRGMLGWIAALGNECLQIAAIRLDPYAVLANGDPSVITASAKKILLTALEELAERDPMFRRSDLWRRFNIGHFFTAETLDQVRAILAKEGALRGLILELLTDTDAVSKLTTELTALMRNADVDDNTRDQAFTALISDSGYAPANDIDYLIAEGTADALEIAAKAVMRCGVSSLGTTQVSLLLSKLSVLYPKQGARHRSTLSRYHIRKLIKSFEFTHVQIFLDNLSGSLECTCSPKHEYLCSCRHGKSKVIGGLLDRYFELAPTALEPTRIWSWLKSLHFRGSLSSEYSPAVKHLNQDHDLRRAIQRLAVEGVAGEEEARSAVRRLYSSYAHSGLHIQDGDHLALIDHAFASQLVDVWSELCRPHNIYGDTKGPNPIRARQREQSRTSSTFLAAWSRREKAWRSYARSERGSVYPVRRKRYAHREAAAIERKRAHFRENLLAIESGKHWSWLRHLTTLYLFPDEANDVVEDPEITIRALRNCFPMLQAHVPTVEMLGRGERRDIAEVLLAACLVRFRDGESLATVDSSILAAAKTEASSYPTFTQGEDKLFEDALDAALFELPSCAESFIRRYVEQQLAAEGGSDNVHWLDQKSAFQHLKATLPLEWLEHFPEMPLQSARSLFDMAATYGNREALLSLIDRRLDDTVVRLDADAEAEKRAKSRREFWQLNAFFYQSKKSDAAWESLKAEPKTIFTLEHRIGRFSSRETENHPSMTADNVFKILDAYVDAWPKVPLPSSWGTGDPPEETAYRFLCDCIWKISEDAPDARIPVLNKILADPRFSNFRDAALTLREEAYRKAALQDFRAPHPSEINMLLDKNGIASVEDLRALLVEEFGELQKWLDGSETDPLDAFYPGGRRLDENTARNRIVDQLQGRMLALGLSVVIERHMSGGHRCDITATASVEGANRLLVIEVKGQWNRELYTSASKQLDQRYAVHPEAGKQGIYLALWYGNGEKIAGRSDNTITTAAQLRDQIKLKMPTELRTRIDVVVLDLSRPVPAARNVRTSAVTQPKKPRQRNFRSL